VFRKEKSNPGHKSTELAMILACCNAPGNHKLLKISNAISLFEQWPKNSADEIKKCSYFIFYRSIQFSRKGKCRVVAVNVMKEYR
jgi:hypothetical protein